MNGKFYLIFLVNIPLFGILYCAYFINGYGLGYASNDSHTAAAWRLYLVYMIVQLLINFFLHLILKALKPFSITVTSLEILLLYGLVAWHYR